MQSLINQIGVYLQTPSGQYPVIEGRLLVAYERGLHTYLAECAALALVSTGLSTRMRAARLNQLMPELAGRLERGDSVFPGDVTGADLGLALCTLGVNPFVTPTERGLLNMDSLGWRVEAIMSLVKAYDRSTGAAGAEQPKTVVKRAPLSVPPVPDQRTVGAPAAQLPVEFLVMLYKMLGDVGFHVTLMKSISQSQDWPDWQFTSMVDQDFPRVRYFSDVRVAVQEKHEIYFARFSNRVAIQALLRAVIAIVHARDHVTNAHTRAALPPLLQWAIHAESTTGTVVSPNEFYFSVLVERPRSNLADKTASDGALLPFFNALYTHLGVYPIAVPPEAAVDTDGALRLRFPALLGAASPLVGSAHGAPWLWLQRRAPGLTAKSWYIADKNAISHPDRGRLGDYGFKPSLAMLATVQPDRMTIGLRLDVNPNCRSCGDRLPPNHASLTCAHH